MADNHPNVATPSKLRRVTRVTLQLVGIGAILGALFGFFAFLAEALLLPGTVSTQEMLQVAGFAAAFGALLGGILAPAVSWVLLRNVSIGRALRDTAIGALVGLSIGALISPIALVPLALTGFLVAALRLWWITRPRATHSRSRANR